MKSRVHSETLAVLASAVALVIGTACSTAPPTPPLKHYKFPKGEAYIEDVARPYQALGQVKTKITYDSLDFKHDENQLCRNYYNKAVKDLVARAKDSGGDAVIKVRSFVFYEDGRSEAFKTPECADDGEEGEILTVGTVVKWLPREAPAATSVAPAPPPQPKGAVEEAPTELRDEDDGSGFSPAESAPRPNNAGAVNPASPLYHP